ncbi:tRNA pseudouridine(38-40) synthase TruA [Treponema pallidum]|uniref:tRNA pseudouridine synthase A n=2 Tax=Treponema pallidum TaxID=160 RepID=A0AAU8RPW4_TREPL|nr:tRNA pseudouridine(38-40) synthase TruA [Treponema pallidum]AEZ57962.1 tRNA-pseudouridine synthase I [Treponema pallidum subsp. pertenue str. SamoaD]AEZ59031.1 tRNA-pseudouridine synthase I [Treponema pallidum subsp. pertenue str. CDC2]AEZ60099.1 tRNA-pseudouridine synthase I [Treponema pallidum subsp. pertenue str. Gauthier]AGK84483.1 tRNA-pseudouridine synthase I [Treponema pallidum str. Fribourg-Blanc]AJB40859.1 tRNA-pseudouridine synthase I [Treponema pallidum subsp. endemicum str. Bosn
MNDVRKILLRISYDGTRFCGWQKQVSGSRERAPSVQGELEKVAEKIHHQKIAVIGSGRTDSGVHAVGQAAHFCTPMRNILAYRFIPAFNSLLPHSIRITDARDVSSQLHARFSAVMRTYRYHLHCAPVAYAHELPYCWHIARMPDIHLLNQYAATLKGELDCTSFAAAGDKSASKSRYFYDTHFSFNHRVLTFEISANAFLWKMVRSLTGTLLHCEKKRCSVREFVRILHAKDRRLAGPTAPPHGLFLWNIRYPEHLLRAE